MSGFLDLQSNWELMFPTYPTVMMGWNVLGNNPLAEVRSRKEDSIIHKRVLLVSCSVSVVVVVIQCRIE